MNLHQGLMDFIRTAVNRYRYYQFSPAYVKGIPFHHPDYPCVRWRQNLNHAKITPGTITLTVTILCNQSSVVVECAISQEAQCYLHVYDRYTLLQLCFLLFDFEKLRRKLLAASINYFQILADSA